jgi:3-phosphoglycerate kinase
MLRVNGFRGTIVGAEAQSSSVYNYGQVFQEPMKQLINSLKQGDLLLLDNITVAVGDGSTRSASSILYKIVN